MSECTRCGAPVSLSSSSVTICPFCKAENQPPPREVEVPVPVQLVQNVVKVESSTQTAHELRCPHCGKRLFGVKLDDAGNPVELAGCAGCGGIWIDNESGKHVLSAPKKIFADLAKRAASNARGRVVRSERPTCPICPAVLDRVMLRGIELDTCNEHGTWFDSHELDRLVAILNGEPSELVNANSTCVYCRQTFPQSRINLGDEGPACDMCWRQRQSKLVRQADEQIYGDAQGPTAAAVVLGIAGILLAGSKSS